MLWDGQSGIHYRSSTADPVLIHSWWWQDSTFHGYSNDHGKAYSFEIGPAHSNLILSFLKQYSCRWSHLLLCSLFYPSTHLRLWMIRDQHQHRMIRIDTTQIYKINMYNSIALFGMDIDDILIQKAVVLQNEDGWYSKTDWRGQLCCKLV